MIKKLLISSIASLFLIQAQAQFKDSSFQVHGYAEAYYVYDFNIRGNLGPERAPFLFNHNRHNQVSINLAMVNFRYNKDGVRANIGLQSGTYPMDNYAGEPTIYQHIAEANLGVALDKNERLWLDAGIMPSHLGFASLISQENITLSRSLAAENSPYYSAGAKLTYATKNDRWQFGLHYLNGWQQIRKNPGFRNPAFGTEVAYKREKFSLHWNTYLGNERPSASLTDVYARYFSNLYAEWKPIERLKLLAGFDAGMQETRFPSFRQWDDWYCATLMAQFGAKKLKAGIRGEYYVDNHGVIIQPLPTNVGFGIMGLSVNVDYSIRKNALFRIEARQLNGELRNFGNLPPNDYASFSIATSLAVKF